MDLLRIASRVAAGSVKAQFAWFEGSSATDVVYTLPSHDMPGPVWAAWHGFGWLMVTADPASLADDTPVELVDGAMPTDAKTWGELTADVTAKADGAAEGWEAFPSVEDFACSETFVWFACSHDREELPELVEELQAAGLERAAAAAQAEYDSGAEG